MRIYFTVGGLTYTYVHTQIEHFLIFFLSRFLVLKNRVSECCAICFVVCIYHFIWVDCLCDCNLPKASSLIVFKRKRRRFAARAEFGSSYIFILAT